MNPLQDVFISYGRVDSKQFAKHLKDCLVASGYTVWFDFDDIPVGVDYQKQIDDGIEKADNFVFIIAPHSVNSAYCRLEIELALKHKKRIIPLLHVEQINREIWQQRYPQGTDAQWTEYTAAGKHSSFPNMHPEISKINWVNFREGLDNFETALQDLIALLEQQKDYVHYQTVLLQRALEWERNQKQTLYLLIGEERLQAEAWLATRFTDSQPPCLPSDLHYEFITESIKNANNLMTQVFLCHTEEDRAITEQVRRTLMRNRITTWSYRSDIEYGSDFQTAIAHGIEEADNVLFVMSPAALQSEYCQRELDLALQLHKRIIIVLAAPVEGNQIPVALRNRQYIDLTDNQSDADLVKDEDDLLRLLKQDAAYYYEHKVLLTKALNWERQQRNPAILLRGYELQHALAWLKLAQQFPEHSPLPLHQEFITESQRQPPGLPLDVFISYSRADSDFARKLNDGLQRQGKRTWFDQESIASGTDFQQEIHRGIEASDHFLFILSPRSVNSPYCADEVEYAAKLNKRIITVRFRAVDAADVHRELAKVHWVDFLGKDRDFAANFQELIRTLDADPDHLRFHTRLLMQAIDWDEKSRRESLLLRGTELTEAEQWLLQAAGKQPSPTVLQGEYVSTSRRATASQQRQLIGILGSLLIVAVLAAGVAVQQYQVASKQSRVARANEREAQSQSKRADQQRAKAEERRAEAEAARKEADKQRKFAETKKVEAEAALQLARDAQAAEKKQRQRAQAGEAKARQQEQLAQKNAAEAYRQQVIAEANEAEAKKQQQIALGRQLTAQAEAFRQKLDQSPRSTLLAIAAIRRLQDQSGSTADAIKVLNDLRLIPLVPSRVFDPYASNQPGFSSDGQYLVIKKASDTVLWNLETNQKKRLPIQNVVDLTFSSDSRYVSIQSSTGWTLWDIEGDRTTPLPIQENILGVHFSPDDQYLAIRSGTGVTLWKLETNQQTTLSERADSLRFSPNSRYIALRNEKGATLWNIATNSSMTLSEQQVDGLSFSPDSRYIGFYGNWGAKLWDIQANQPQLLPGTRISDLTFSHDSRYIGIEGEARASLWDIQAAHDLPLPEEQVSRLSFSPDGQRVGMQNSTGATLWEMKTNRMWRIPSEDIEGLVFSPDGQYIGTISGQTTGQIWDIATQQEVTRVIHEGGIGQLDFSPSSRYVIANGWNGKVLVAEIPVQQTIARVIHNAGSRQLAFSAGGQYVVTDAGNSSLQVWDIEANRAVAQIHYNGSIRQLTFGPDNRSLVLRSDSNTSIWNLQAKREWTLPGKSIHYFSFSPIGQYLVTYGEDGTKVWNTQTNQPVPLPPELKNVIKLFFSPNDDIGIAKTANGAVLWNLSTLEVKKTLPVKNISNVTFSPGGRYVIIDGDSGKLLWDIPANQAVPLPNVDSIQSLFWGRDDRTLGIITTATTALLWDISTQQTTQLPVNQVYTLSFSPDGRRIGIESETGWNLWDRQTQQIVQLPMTNIKSLIFSTSRSGTAADQYIGIVRDGVAMVWNAATRQGYTLPIDSINGLEVGHDGRTLAIKSQRDAIAWDLETHQTVIKIPYNEEVGFVGFSATGQYLLTQGTRSAGAWLLNVEQLIRESCSRLTRNLTQQEWQQYVGETASQDICPPTQLAQQSDSELNAVQPVPPVRNLLNPLKELLSALFARLTQE
jgi:WD40 repeat protein